MGGTFGVLPLKTEPRKRFLYVAFERGRGLEIAVDRKA